MTRRAGFIAIGVIVTISLLYSGAWSMQRVAPESSPAARGAAYAQTKGCVGCHGDPENVLVDISGMDCASLNKLPSHPDFDMDCTDLMAYFGTVRLSRNFDDRAKNGMVNPLIAGEHLVRKYHCFQCHGQMGQGGFKNAGSFKGYVPGYFGNDFKLLTNNANPESVRAWITHGMDSEIVETPVTGRIAAYFFGRQAVNMPSYQSLDSEEIEILVNYVIALNQFGPMTVKTIRLYDQQSRSADSFTSINP
jgi:cytochrome c553